MATLIQFNLLLISTCTSRATVERIWFKEMDQNFTGRTVEEHVARTPVHCSVSILEGKTGSGKMDFEERARSK